MDDGNQTTLEIGNEIAELKRRLDYRSEIDKLRLDLVADARKSDLQELKQALDYRGDLAAFKAEVALQLSYFKWVAATAGTCIAMLGFLGIKGWSDLTKSADTLMSKKLSEMTDRYSNLSRGFSLHDSGRSADAMPYLTPLYEANHYDEPVLIALFEAMGNLGDCEGIFTRFAQLRDDTEKFDRIKDPMVYGTLGYSLRDCSDNKPKKLSDAKAIVDLTLKKIPATDPLRRYPFYYLFTLAFIENDVPKAKHWLENASTVVEGYPNFSATRNEVWYTKLIKARPSAGWELDAMSAEAMRLQKETFSKK